MYAIEILQAKLKVLSDAYDKCVVNGHTKPNALGAIEIMNKRRSLTEAIKKLKGTEATSRFQREMDDSYTDF